MSISENSARLETFCRGCGRLKEAAPSYPVVCRSCWDGEGLLFATYKHFTGTYAEWLAHVEARTGKAFYKPSVFATCSLPSLKLEILRVNRWARRAGASRRDQFSQLALFRPALQAKA